MLRADTPFLQSEWDSSGRLERELSTKAQRTRMLRVISGPQVDRRFQEILVFWQEVVGSK